MLIGRIEGANAQLSKPEGWNDEAGECQELPVRQMVGPMGPVMASAWHPTPEEVERIQAGEPVLLYVFGNQHPPVMLGVREPDPSEAKVALILPSHLRGN